MQIWLTLSRLATCRGVPLAAPQLCDSQSLEGVFAEAGPGEAPNHAQRHVAHADVEAANQQAEGDVNGRDRKRDVLSAQQACQTLK